MSAGNGRWALSGGIGSGKSAVRRLLANAGVVTIDADAVGHRVLEPGGRGFEAAAHRFPAAVSGGIIDRKALAAIVFSDPGELAALEGITHPHIFDTIHRDIQEIDGPVVVEVPLLKHGLGTGWRRIVIDAGEEVRLERSVSRGMSRDDVIARMAAQPTRGEWLAAADLVIPNDGTLVELEAAVATVIDRL